MSFQGWKCSCRVRDWRDLPVQAREYVVFVEAEIGVKVCIFLCIGMEAISFVLYSRITYGLVSARSP